MEELNKYLQWCDEQYVNSFHCNCEKTCLNNNFCKGNQENCYLCIKRVHHYKNKTVHYNCGIMLYCYVLKHCYRFVYEIFYQFYRLKNKLSNYDEIFVCSIGCGPCTELFGAIDLWRSLGKQDEKFHYKGYDTEPLWSPLMNKACSYFVASDVHCYCEDIFLQNQNNQEVIDIIILNYMLSDMFKFHREQYNEFLTNLCELIFQKHPSFLLINDVYLIDSVKASNNLLTHLKDVGLTYKSVKLQYHILHPYIGSFGEQIPKPPFTMSNSKIVREYAPFSEVNSIQSFILFLWH